MTAAIQSLKSIGLRILDGLLEEHDVKEAFEIFTSMVGDESETIGAMEYHLKNADPYVQYEPITNLQAPQDYRIDGDGSIRVKNLSAFWIPKFTLQREIGGPLYSVSGSHHGHKIFNKKYTEL